jgi:Tat protein translocase TatB subunit
MFGLGMGELLVILVIALIFLGPKRLPDVASTLGKAIRSFRKATNELTDQLQVDESVKEPLRELRAALRDEPTPHVLATQKPPAQVVPVEPPKAAAPADEKQASPPAGPSGPPKV